MKKTSRKTEERKYRLPGLVYRYYPMFAIAVIILAWLTLGGGR